MTVYSVARLFLVVALILLPLGSTPAAEADARAAWEREDYDTAFREFMPLAVAGDPRAQGMIGLMHEFGLGAPQDDAEAARWYRRSAEQGASVAQFRLGDLYATGKGVLQDYAEALHWYRLAADQGNADAQVALGNMFFQRQGVVQDYTEAEKWARLAAEQGNALGQVLLGILYDQGLGLSRDAMLAHMWLNLGTAGLPAGVRRDAAVELRDTVAKELTTAQLARAQELARNWRPGGAATPETGALVYGDKKRGEPPPARAARTFTLEQVAIMEFQGDLADLGYDPGPRDGVMGARTRAAIRAFQADVGLPIDGEISDDLAMALKDAASSGRRVTARADPPKRRLDRTGTGFAVSEHGYLVTNHHVVAGCAEVRVQSQDREAASAVVVALDPGNDLALLTASVQMPAPNFRNDEDVRPGDSVVAVGFPLYGLLAKEANVTTGTVSAMAGIGDDPRFVQVTVPVQPGSSGGPLLDLQGRVVGVVVGKLDALRVASATGDIPQNINFAIKSSVVRNFLEASGVAQRRTISLEEAYGKEPRQLSAAAVGAQAKEYTVLVECWK